MTHDPSQSKIVRPFTRQSTVLDLVGQLEPQAEGLVVALVDGDPEAFGIEAVNAIMHRLDTASGDRRSLG